MLSTVILLTTFFNAIYLYLIWMGHSYVPAKGLVFQLDRSEGIYLSPHPSSIMRWDHILSFDLLSYDTLLLSQVRGKEILKNSVRAGFFNFKIKNKTLCRSRVFCLVMLAFEWSRYLASKIPGDTRYSQVS